MNADIQYYSDATIHSISEKLLLDILANYLLLGPRGPLVPPLVDPSVYVSARKIWIAYIQAYMPQESSEDSLNQPNGPMGSPRSPP